MKKSSFFAFVLGTVSGVFFAIGMCMALLPQWNAFKQGIGMGCSGLVLALITLIVWRRMEHKEPIHITGKMILIILLGVLGALGLGVGMCLTMVWSHIISGIVVGLIGIVLLLSLLPVCKGLRD